MKILIVAAASIAALAVAVAPSAGGPSACKPGKKKVGKIVIYVNCGPAKATVTAGGKTYKIFGGTCQTRKAAKLYQVDVGIFTTGGKPTGRYLGIRSKKLVDGVTKTAGVAVQVAGKSYTVAPNVVKVSGGLKRGTFAGDSLGPLGAVKGSWTC